MKGNGYWIDAGYEMFANEGILNIEKLAKIVGISKSSFYHHFADTEIFMDCLLNYHFERSKEMALKESLAKSINPGIVQIILAHQTDLLFNRRLRTNRHRPCFKKTLEASNKLIAEAFIPLWIKELNLSLTPAQIEGVFSLALENFFSQLTAETLNETWLVNYFDQLKISILNLVDRDSGR